MDSEFPGNWTRCRRIYFLMPQHRFLLGDRVRIVRTASANYVEAFAAPNTPRDTSTVWTVVRLVPSDDSGPQYHVRAENGSARAVHEHELDKA